MLFVGSLSPPMLSAGTIDVTDLSTVTVNPGDTIDVYFNAAEFMNSLPAAWNPSLPVAVGIFGLTSYGVGQSLSDFLFNAWVQSPTAPISIPFPDNPLPVVAGNINSGQNYPVSVLSSGLAVPIPSGLASSLFGADGTSEALVHLEYVGDAPFVFEGANVPPLEGTEMGHGAFGGLLSVDLEVNITYNGQSGTSSAVGNVDQILLTTVPEPRSLTLALVVLLAFFFRKISVRRRELGGENASVPFPFPPKPDMDTFISLKTRRIEPLKSSNFCGTRDYQITSKTTALRH